MRCLLLAVLLLLSACTPTRTTLRIAGSTSVQPLAEVLAESYTKAGGGRVSIQGGGSSLGVQAVLNGIADLGAISRSLAESESARGLVEHIIGYDLLTVVVNPDNPVDGLTRGQLRDIFRGAVTDWRQLGGRPGPVTPISREAGSGSREAFRRLVGPINKQSIVMNSNGAIGVGVKIGPGAIGYVSFAIYKMGGLKALAIDGLQPDDPGYPLVRSISFITRGQPGESAAAFLRFVRSLEGRRLITEEGLVPVPDGPEK